MIEEEEIEGFVREIKIKDIVQEDSLFFMDFSRFDFFTSFLSSLVMV